MTTTGFRLDQMFEGRPIFIEPVAFRAWLSMAAAKVPALQAATAVDAAMQMHAGRSMAPTVVGDVAVIDIEGPITYRSTWLSTYFGMASIEDLQARFRAALADATVKSILFRCDTPGGTIDFCPEFAAEIFAARGQKPMTAVADTLIASAGYWLAAQADTIVASQSSELGSIGVFCMHGDYSKMFEKMGVDITFISFGEHKVDGNPYEPLSDSARAELQASVDEIGGWFETAVARGRGVTRAVVHDTFGQGKVFRGQQAIKLGLADKAGTFGAVLTKLTKGNLTMRGDAGVQPPAWVASVASLVAAKATPVVGCQACDDECPCHDDEDRDDECPENCPECSFSCACKAKADDTTDDQQASDAARGAAEASLVAAIIADESGLG